MKTLLYLILFLTGILACMPAFAQDESTLEKNHFSVGLNGGYVANHLYSSTGYRAYTKYENGSGFTLGIPVQYQFNDWFAVQAEPSYIQKNYSLVRTQEYAEIYNNWTNSYVQLPLLAQFSFGGEKLRGFFNAGGFMGFWANSHVEGTTTAGAEYYNQTTVYVSYDENYPFDSRRDNRFEAGLLTGAGIKYALNSCTVFVEGRFYYSLTDMQKDYMLQQTPRYNDTYTIQAGVLFHIF